MGKLTDSTQDDRLEQKPSIITITLAKDVPNM